MKVYIASWFASKEEMVQQAEELRAHGIEVTSRWLEEKVSSNVQITDVSESYLRETAQVDIEDILRANIVVLNVPSLEKLKDSTIPTASWARGGRHFEAGFQYATMVFLNYLPKELYERGTRYLWLVGRKENVFHYLNDLSKNGTADGMTLPIIRTFETWDAASESLIKEHTILQEYKLHKV